MAELADLVPERRDRNIPVYSNTVTMDHNNDKQLSKKHSFIDSIRGLIDQLEVLVQPNNNVSHTVLSITPSRKLY